LLAESAPGLLNTGIVRVATLITSSRMSVKIALSSARFSAKNALRGLPLLSSPPAAAILFRLQQA
jgi:hypothetical protein